MAFSLEAELNVILDASQILEANIICCNPNFSVAIPMSVKRVNGNPVLSAIPAIFMDCQSSKEKATIERIKRGVFCDVSTDIFKDFG